LKKRRAGRARDATDPSNASELVVVTGSCSLRFLFIVVAAFYLLVP
jgi:hypothetical protein